MKAAVFICGCGHTGTSLLANMFAAHPDVFVPLRETETFLDEQQAPARLASLLAEAKASAKPHLVEKTPKHIHKLDLIRSMVPGARFILTVRDGRDVAASFIKRVGSARPGVDRWLEECAIVRGELQRSDTTLVRYEDLIENTEAELQRLCTFASIPYSEAMLAYYAQQRLWFGVEAVRKGTGAAGIEHRLLRNWQINQPIFDGRGAWKTTLPPADRHAFETGRGRELMEFFGYIAPACKQEIESLKEELAALRRQQVRSAEMAADAIAAFGETFRRAQRPSNAGSDASVRLSDSAVVFPLGVKDQQVVLSASDAARSVSAVVLCVDASDVVTLRVESEAGIRIVELIAGEPTLLLDNLPAGTDVTFKVRRVGGELCLLRLETPSPVLRNSRPQSKGTLWRALQLVRANRADLAVEVGLSQASDIERPALNLLHATLAVQDEAAWLSHLNSYVEQFGIAPIRLRSADAPRFMRLDAQPGRTIANGPTVTVIMSAFNAERTLEFAAASILKQSWQPLELIVIDDCSSDATWQIAQRLERLDSRVRVFRNNANVGPYVSKNLALSLANGAYITCHDADDWAHPQRIEKQVEAMRNAQARACVAGWLRFDESGVFTGVTRVGRQSDDGALQLAHVTCMLETDFMRRHVGHWDSVRFAADGEMLERLEHILGNGFLRLRQLAVLSLNVPSSLTNDPVHGISKLSGLSPTRRAYRDAWRQWHATLTPESAYLPFPQAGRPFPAPDECVVSREALNVVRASSVSSRGY